MFCLWKVQRLLSRLQPRKKRMFSHPGHVTRLVGASSYPPKGFGFDSLPRHIPLRWVQSQVAVLMGAKDACFSHYAFLSLSVLSFLSKMNINIFKWGLKNQKHIFPRWFLFSGHTFLANCQVQNAVNCFAFLFFKFQEITTGTWVGDYSI